MTVAPARRSAFEILRRVETESRTPQCCWPRWIRECAKTIARCVMNWCLGVLRRKLWLDKSHRTLWRAQDREVGSGCASGARDRSLSASVSDSRSRSAAVNESVNFVRASRVKSAAGFVNAVLRRATREPDYDPAATFPIRSRSYRSRLRIPVVDRALGAGVRIR